MARPRLIDVANQAGVSVGTASDALAGKNRIPEETRERIRAVAASLGYVPNRVARALQKGYLPLIGLSVAAMRRPAEFDAYRSFWATVIATATRATAERGYAVTVLPQYSDSDLVSLPLAGLIVVDAESDDPEIRTARELGIPFATDAVDQGAEAAVLAPWDFSQTVALVMDHFLENGASRPALTVPGIGDATTTDIVATYERWCYAHGIEPLCVQYDLTDPESPAKDERQLIDAGADALYIIAPDRSANFGLIATRHHRGDSRVLLALLDDDADGKLASLGITTVNVGIRDIIQHMCDALIAVAEGRTDRQLHITAEFRLEARASSLPLPKWDGVERRRSSIR